MQTWLYSAKAVQQSRHLRVGTEAAERLDRRAAVKDKLFQVAVLPRTTHQALQLHRELQCPHKLLRSSEDDGC